MISKRFVSHIALPISGSSLSRSRSTQHLLIRRQLPVTTPKCLHSFLHISSNNKTREVYDKQQWRLVKNVFADFYHDEKIKEIALSKMIDRNMFKMSMDKFKDDLRKGECSEDVHELISRISNKTADLQDLYEHFHKYAATEYPHIQQLDTLKPLVDLTNPCDLYPLARELKRKIVFHAGPTNSGKTYHALQRFLKSDSGVYCSPLKLLSAEVNDKANSQGTPCDLVTGEDRRYAVDPENPSAHTSCTVEMASVTERYEVAVIDEIQMIKSFQRGWAWTRALLGIAADEIHLCGEETSVDLVRDLLKDTEDEIEVKRYKRKTSLTLEDKPLETLENIRPGDCIVCFNKRQIYEVKVYLDEQGIQSAVIYGGLPPSVKMKQAQRFNDPNDPCNVMVATDAIGMGLNLSIRRVVFYSLQKRIQNTLGKMEMVEVPVSDALQIAGRAGRFNTQYEEGFVTCFRPKDYEILKRLLSTPPPLIKQAGLDPSSELVMELAMHLPNYSFSAVLEIVSMITSLDSSSYFMCDLENAQMIAREIDSLPLDLRSRVLFCGAPIGKNKKFLMFVFLKMIKAYAEGEAITLSWLLNSIKWPLPPPHNPTNLTLYEEVFDVLDLYLWLSYRLPHVFLDREEVRDIQTKLDDEIQNGLGHVYKFRGTRTQAGKIGISRMQGKNTITKSEEREQTVLDG